MDTEEDDSGPEDHDETEREITRLRNRSTALAMWYNVVEEYEEEAERFAFLTEQLADVQQAAAVARDVG